jgi:hypothetical protein
MIVKIKSYKRMAALQPVIYYVLGNRERLFNKKGRSFLFTNNFKGQTPLEWVHEIRANEKHRRHKRKNNVMFTQEIISFHRGDSKNISIPKMRDITGEYIRLRNPNGLYIATPHFDKHHWHIHIIAAAVEYGSGKSLRMSREQLGQLKKDIQAYQLEKYPELSRSVVRHGRKKKAKLTEKEYQYKMRTRKRTKREEIRDIINSCARNVNSQDEFFERLRSQKLETYVRGGKIYGVTNGEKRYRFKTLGIDLDSITLEKNIGPTKRISENLEIDHRLSL